MRTEESTQHQDSLRPTRHQSPTNSNFKNRNCFPNSPPQPDPKSTHNSTSGGNGNGNQTGNRICKNNATSPLAQGNSTQKSNQKEPIKERNMMETDISTGTRSHYDS